MRIIKVALTIIILLVMSNIALADTALHRQVKNYLDAFDSLNAYQRGEAEQQIAHMVLSPNYIETCSIYRRLHHSSNYFDQDLMGRRTRMFRYILTNQNWDTSQLQEMANELFVAGYSWEAVTILNYLIDGRLPSGYK